MISFDRDRVAEEFARLVSEQKMCDEEAEFDFLRRRKSDYRWLMEDSGDLKHPSKSSFRWLCIEFDLDPETVRRAVRKARAKSRKDWLVHS